MPVLTLWNIFLLWKCVFGHCICGLCCLCSTIKSSPIFYLGKKISNLHESLSWEPTPAITPASVVACARCHQAIGTDPNFVLFLIHIYAKGSISTLGKAKRGAKSRRVEENVTTFAIFEAVIKTDNKKGIVRLAPHMLFIDGYYWGVERQFFPW